MQGCAIRMLEPGEEDGVQDALMRHVWHAAYAHIYSGREIDAHFDGRSRVRASWAPRRTAPVGTLVCEEGSGVIGLAGLAILEPGTGELAAFYVLPDRQGQGVGRALWDAAVAALRERGCGSMEVWTLSRAGAWRFYEHRGCGVAGVGSFTLDGHVEAVTAYRLVL